MKRVIVGSLRVQVVVPDEPNALHTEAWISTLLDAHAATIKYAVETYLFQLNRSVKVRTDTNRYVITDTEARNEQ